MFKVNFQSSIIAAAIVMLLIYGSFYLFGKNLGLQAPPSVGPNAELRVEQSEKHPIIGRSKNEISSLFPGNCFAEIYLRNTSFNGKLIASCKAKSTEQIKAITGQTIAIEELTSPKVVAYLKSVYGENNPWRL